MSETAPSSTPVPQVWLTLQAHDAPALIRFYVEVLGFVAVAVYAEGDQVAHAQLSWPEGGGIMMGSHKPGRPWVREPGTFGAYVVTDRVAELIRPPTRPSPGVARAGPRTVAVVRAIRPPGWRPGWPSRCARSPRCRSS